MNEEKQQNKKINHDVLKWIIIGLAGFVIIVLIFSAGMFVGGMKARFSYRWAESYHKNFAGPRGGFFGDWQALPSPGDFIESHGTFGEIIKINDSDFVIKGQSDVEKVILITEGTIIQKGRDAIKKEELKVGDQIVIIGSPNEEGQIEAKLIRVFDEKEITMVPMPRRPFFFR
ncbi:MAG: hypothetical protein NT012_01575 [Candidatus Nealsonbacteria bacterium]|nr:hypothetical protein [Candidatus Nealsonbacteria bacterium]